MRQSNSHLVGRDEELAVLAGLLDGRTPLPATVVLAGDAGIGKTSLWLAGRAAATDHGFRVLSARPSEAETRFSFAVLADLLADVVDAVLPELPPVQRRSLEAALLLGDGESRVDDRAVAAAFLGALRLLARDGPVCLAVDDAQWLDAASLAALQYALARLDEEPIAGLLTIRGDLPTWVRRTVPEDRLRVVEVGALSIGALRELLRTQADAAFSRPTLIRIWETSGGNPLFALELADALLRRGGSVALGEELPLPSTVDGLLQARLDGLSADAFETVSVVAALADPTVTLLEAAVGQQFVSGLTDAKAARIVERDGDQLRFTHPLLRSAVVARHLPPARRALHLRLAEIVPTTEERARHLALSTVGPTGEIAAVLEQAARSAQARGAPAAAAELADQALRLTPSGDISDVSRRRFHAAELHHIAGDTDRAVRLLEQARAEASAGPERAAVLLKLSELVLKFRPQEGETLLGLALSEAAGDETLVATTHSRLATAMRWSGGIERGLAHAALAARAAADTDHADLRCLVIASEADWKFRAGHGIQRAEMEVAVALERSLPGWPAAGGPTEYYCHQLLWANELDLSRELTLEVLEARQAAHDSANAVRGLWSLGLLEWRAGNWDEASWYVDQFVDLRSQLGGMSHTDEFPAALLAAHRGEVEEAREAARHSIARGAAAGVRIEQAGHAGVLGFVELSLGDPTAALEHLRPSYEIKNAFMLEPAMRLELGDLLEALIAVGDLDEADDVLATWEPRARAVERAWALAILARCRGLLLAARGDLDGSFERFGSALSEHARSTDPFHHARTLLALGRTQRRAKKRGAARSTLEDALGRFERLGAPLWAEQARAELGRIGGRAPSRGALTESEQRIAGLVARGLSNREVAAALFLTEHSVETALTRIYRKLGVRSRTELASRYPAKT